MAKRLCSTCNTPLPRLELATDHREYPEPWFRCRKCVLRAGARANVVLAQKRLEREMAA